jgi:protein-disulfide isomerase/uncharacterized membrane protein
MTKDEKRILWVRRGIFGLSLIGIFIATYLFITYTSDLTIACGGSYGCDVVRASRWAHLFGLPMPLYGILFYTGMAVLMIVRAVKPTLHPRWMYRLMMVGATVGLIESIFLTGVQALEIKQYCTWCLASAVTATLIFVASWGDRHQHIETDQGAKEFRIQFFTVFGFVIVGAIALFFLLSQKTGEQKPVIQQIAPPSTEASSAAQKLLYPSDLEFQGSATATVTIVEFVDFECPACRAFYPEFQKVQKQLGSKLRYAYRMFPLPIHEHSFDAALAAECAKKQGMFYQYADLLMEEEGLDRNALVRRAAELRLNMDEYMACLNGSESKDAIRKDLEEGDALGVNSTPTIFVNDTMIQGLPTADQLMSVINGK